MLCLSKLDTFDSNIVGILKNIVSTYFFSVICVWYCENIFVACHGQEMSLWKPRYGSSLIFKNERTNTHEDADICIVILSGILTQLHNIPREFDLEARAFLEVMFSLTHSLSQFFFKYCNSYYPVVMEYTQYISDISQTYLRHISGIWKT